MQFFGSVKKRGPFVAPKAFAAEAALFPSVESGARKSFKRWVMSRAVFAKPIIL
jgi:hypothetical protein